MTQPIEWRLQEETTEIPKHIGKEGFVLIIRKLLDLPRVVRIVIDSSGKIFSRRYVKAGDLGEPLDLELRSLDPASIMRNGDMDEVPWPGEGPASTAIARMFGMMAEEDLYPVAFVSGPKSVLWSWHLDTTGVPLGKKSAYGVPVYMDRKLENSALFLCCSQAQGASMIDVQKTFKLVMPEKIEQGPLPVGGFIEQADGKAFGRLQ